MSAIRDFLDRHDARHRHDEVLGGPGRLALLGVAILLVIVAPILEPSAPFLVFLLTRVLIFALFALSLDFVFGYTGLPSFGHAAMFGTGGFAAALLLTNGTQNILVVLPTTFVVGVLVAIAIGWLSVRSRGIYFAMLTLAFAQVLYIVAFNDLLARIFGFANVTGGDNGIVGIPGFEIAGSSLQGTLVYYYLVLFLTIGSVALLFRVANSPFGRVIQGIRENEDRIDALGYNVTLYKVVAFSISGGFAGLAGGLWVPLQTLAHPQILHWQLSGELIVMVLLGGMGTLWGPMFGAALVVLLEDFLSSIIGWRVILGSVFVIVVIFAPTGLAGIIRTLREDPRGAPRHLRNAIQTYLSKVRR